MPEVHLGVLIITALLVAVQSAPTGTLKGLIILHRHGARSPINPTPNTAAAWTALNYGLGELTKSGRAMHKQYGQLLRSKYMNNGPTESLLIDPISYAQVYVRSSDVDRTLQSVQALFQGLYGDSVTLPIHTIPEDYELLLQGTDKCAAYVADYAAVRTRRNTVADQTLAAELDIARRATGWDKTLPSATLVSYAVDNMECEYAQNLTLNALFTPDVKKTLDNFGKDTSFEQFSPTSATDPRGVPSALLISTIAKNLQDITVGKQPSFTVYSAHDTTIIGLMVSLGILNKGDTWWLPFFATSIAFELRQDGTNWYVNALIGNPTLTGTADVESPAGWNYVRNPLQLKCPNLSDQCTLADLTAFIAKQSGSNQETGGCCTRSAGFYSLGCDNYAASYADLTKKLPCQLYRRFCPKTACGPDQILESNTLRCISNTGSGDDGSWKTIGAIFIALAIIFLIVALLVCWRKQVHPAVTDRNYQQVNP
jgi:hypothetical protein